MEEINRVCINDLTNVSGLCRVCLTESKKMTKLHHKIESQLERNIATVTQLLYRVTGIEVPSDERYPSYICPMCVSLLKMSYKFRLQFEASQKLLDEYFGECLPVEQNLASLLEVIQEDQLDVAPVELIIPKQGKYDLKDVFVIEREPAEKPNYSGFLKNLGKEVSASFVNEKMAKSQSTIGSNNPITIINLNDSIQSTEMEEDISKGEDMVVSNGYSQEGDDADDMDEKDKKNNYRMTRCSVCEKVYANKKYLRLHVERMHLHKRQTFVCEICGFLLKSRSSHYHHMLKHCGKRHKCSHCHKTYFSPSTLQQHVIAVHKNTRAHLCTICGKTFNYANALDYHMRIHTDERKYKCSYCGKTFRMQCGLNRHVRIHTGIRPYKCHFCDKAFRSKGELDCHEMIHTGYRPYHCKYCDKGFTKTYNLKMHLLGHAGEHGCELCSKSFIEVEFLKIHMKAAHDVLAETGNDKES